MKTQVTCGKCSGTGKLSEYSHIAKGDCFACSGVGSVMVDLEAKKEELSASNLHKCEWVMNSTPASYENLSYEKLLKIRDFCHWPVEAFPELHSKWFSVGEDAFQAATDDMLAKYRQDNNRAFGELISER